MSSSNLNIDITNKTPSNTINDAIRVLENDIIVLAQNSNPSIINDPIIRLFPKDTLKDSALGIYDMKYINLFNFVNRNKLFYQTYIKIIKKHQRNFMMAQDITNTIVPIPLQKDKHYKTISLFKYDFTHMKKMSNSEILTKLNFKVNNTEHIKPTIKVIINDLKEIEQTITTISAPSKYYRLFVLNKLNLNNLCSDVVEIFYSNTNPTIHLIDCKINKLILRDNNKKMLTFKNITNGTIKKISNHDQSNFIKLTTIKDLKVTLQLIDIQCSSLNNKAIGIKLLNCTITKLKTQSTIHIEKTTIQDIIIWGSKINSINLDIAIYCGIKSLTVNCSYSLVESISVTDKLVDMMQDNTKQLFIDLSNSSLINVKIDCMNKLNLNSYSSTYFLTDPRFNFRGCKISDIPINILMDYGYSSINFELPPIINSNYYGKKLIQINKTIDLTINTNIQTVKLIKCTINKLEINPHITIDEIILSDCIINSEIILNNINKIKLTNNINNEQSPNPLITFTNNNLNHLIIQNKFTTNTRHKTNAVHSSTIYKAISESIINNLELTNIFYDGTINADNYNKIRLTNCAIKELTLINNAHNCIIRDCIINKINNN